MRKYLICLLGAGMLLVGCKKEQLEMSAVKDPCSCAKEVSADFDILEENLPILNSVLTLTDNVLYAKNVYFRAKEKDAAYTWYIGADVETEQETSKFFGSEWIGHAIPITLVVKKDPNKRCFPNDDGYDSITKVFYVFDRCMNPHLLEGTFRVAPLNSIDSFDVHIDFQYGPSPNVCYSMNFTNFDKQGSVCTAENLLLASRSYRSIQTSGSTSYNSGCRNLTKVNAYIGLDNILELKYEYRNSDGGSKIYRDLSGRKL
jgi:hypothetical protein